jgi:uncharacterized repeat protein (TIGR03803 family)
MHALRVSVLTGITTFAIAGVVPLPGLAAPGITLINSFTGANGDEPYAELAAAGGGLFYGTTVYGGNGNLGTIFELDSNLDSVSVKAKLTFVGTGGRPYSALTPAGNGRFYGSTTVGGDYNQGTIYEFDPSSGSIVLRASFNDIINNSGSFSALTRAGNGLFYLTHTYNGANSLGAIYEFNPTNAALVIKASFDGTNGGLPVGSLTARSDGLLYGVAGGGGANGAGAIYEFDPSNGSINLLASFAGSINGAAPRSGLTPAGNGSFFGTTVGGGANGQGAIYKFDPSNGSIALMASFDGLGGSTPYPFPYGPLVSEDNNLFYGATYRGGADSKGAIYKFDPSNGSIALVASFNGSNGLGPVAGLTSSGNGIFYGTASEGGVNNFGTVFKFDAGVTNPAVPGPLPLMGATAAFGWSRKLRRRVQQVRPVFPTTV